MQPIYYYEYVPGLIGIETNIKGFRWGFGKCKESVNTDNFDKCLIKIHLEEKSDARVFDNVNLANFDFCFRHFKSHPGTKSLIFDQTVGNLIHLRFVLTIKENSVIVTVGKSYMRLVKTKIMNVHPISYILFDVASFLLLQNGLTTIYCSSVHFEDGRNLVIMSPPNTGKSLTALKLVKEYGAKIIAEDMAVTDGEKIIGATFTNLYRKYDDKSLVSFKNDCVKSWFPLDYLVFLQKASLDSSRELTGCSEKIILINHYSLGYYYSPCLRAMNFYNEDIAVSDALEVEKRILLAMQSKCRCFLIEGANPMNFFKSIFNAMN